MPGIINFFLLSSIQRSFVVVCMRGGPRPPNVSLAFNTPLPARPEGGPCYNPTRHIHNEGPSFDRREVIDDISRHIPSTYYTYNTTMFQTLSVSMQVMCPIFFIVIGMMQEYCELDQKVLIVDL